MEIARAACQKAGHGKVAASLGPTGYFVSPVGDTSFDEMYQVYREQADAIAAAQPDYFLLETFSDLGETRRRCWPVWMPDREKFRLSAV